MKIRTIVAASALAATGVIGAVGGGQSASAGCGVSLTTHNLESGTATVNWGLSKVRAAPLGVAGTWATLGNYSTNVGSDAQTTRAFNLAFGCGVARQYKLYVTEGGNAWYEYFPSTSTWTNDESPHIHLAD